MVLRHPDAFININAGRSEIHVNIKPQLDMMCGRPASPDQTSGHIGVGDPHPRLSLVLGAPAICHYEYGNQILAV